VVLEYCELVNSSTASKNSVTLDHMKTKINLYCV